ncbi:MAG: hypothetical protein JJ855_05475 [Rhodospirillales bacterium]|nr:hypothetical protein [Rhodospirillales bacterium]
MATAPEKLPSQEKLLTDYVRRLEKLKDGRGLAHIHLSKLLPFNRRDQHIRTAAGNFDPLIKDMNGQLFTLKNADLFFFFKTSVKGQVETIVQKVRFLFGDDPLVEEEGKDGREFVTWYDASGQYEEVVQLVQGLADAEEKRQTEVRNRMDARQRLKEKQKKGEPLTPSVLAKVEESLSRADLSNLVRRQFICKVDGKMVPEQLFSELFISIQDLRETILPGVNLVSNRWLFQHLTETLDRRVLSMLMKTDAVSISGDISFNINIRTLLSDQFQIFDDNLSAARRGAIVIELQKEDIFSDLSSYLFAREFVQTKGYRLCLDGLTLETLQVIDRERLGADLAKIVWHPNLADGGDEVQATIKKLIDRDGPDRWILCRCDNREAIDFGRAVGIDQFQGRFVENLIAEDGRRRDLLKLKRRIERSSEPQEEDA